MKKTIFAALGTMLLTAAASATTVTINDVATEWQGIYVNPVATTTQTHILGVYETRSDHHGADYHPMGTAYVHVSGSADSPINLVLSSYEPTNWVLDGEGVSSIGTIMINGFHQSTVTGFSANKIIDKTKPGNYFASSAFAWPNDDGGGNTPGLVAGVEAYFKAPISSFTGAYRSNDISINISSVPEAGTSAYLALGLLGVAAVSRMKRDARKQG